MNTNQYIEILYISLVNNSVNLLDLKEKIVQKKDF